MHFNLISNLHNGAGLERDCKILAERLAEAGHTSKGIQFNEPAPLESRADVNIFIEVLTPDFFRLARRQWIFVNAEWFSIAWQKYLPRFEKVIVKTRHAFDLLRPITRKEQLVYTGFEARDFYDASVPRKPSFLHVAGKSRTKNTEQVIEAWGSGDGLPPLTVLSSRLTSKPAGASWLGRVSDDELAKLKNEHIFALHPSSYEGFGHSLWESLGCGSILLATDTEPMRSIGGHCPEALIRTCGIKSRKGWLAAIHDVKSSAIRDAVRRVMDLPAGKIAAYSARSRQKFLAGRAEFRERFAELVKA